MAVKFRRQGLRDESEGPRGPFSGPRHDSGKPRSRLIVIYIGVLGFVALLLMLDRMGVMPSQPVWNGPIEAAATVVEKREGTGQGARVVIVEIPGEPLAAPLRAEVMVDRESYESVSIGSGLTVTYRINQETGAIEVSRAVLNDTPE